MTICTRCKIDKPDSEFSKEPRKANGLNSHCKKCKAEARKAWYGPSIVEQLQKQIATLTRQRDLAVEALNAWLGIASNCSIESGCCCCGDPMENHSSPMMCGHSPVDMADSAVSGAINKTDKALSAIKESEGK